MGKKSKRKEKLRAMSESMGMNISKVSKIAKRNNRLTPCAVESKKWQVSETYFNPLKKSMKMDGGYVDKNGKEVAEAIGKNYLNNLENSVPAEKIIEEK